MTGAAWVVVQLADVVRRVEDLVGSVPEPARALDRHPGSDEELLIEAGEVEALVRVGEQFAELGSQAQQFGEVLPDGDLWVSRDAVVAAAAEDLSQGIIDPDRVRLAGRVLPVAVGWRALARALRSTDTHAAWGSLRVGELLASFDGAEPRLVARVLAVAGIDAGKEWAVCQASALRRLAAALEEHAPQS